MKGQRERDRQRERQTRTQRENNPTRFIALKDVGEAGAVLDEPVSHVVLGHYHATQAAKIQVGVQCRRLDIDCRLVKVLIGGVGVGE